MTTAPATRPRRREQVLLVALALVAVATVLVMLDAAGWGAGFSSTPASASSVAFLLWALAPIAAAGVVVAVYERRLARGWPALAVGVAVLAALTAVLLVSFVTSLSSTAALVFVFLPVYQWLLVAVTAGVAAVVHVLRVRRRATASAG